MWHFDLAYPMISFASSIKYLYAPQDLRNSVWNLTAPLTSLAWGLVLVSVLSSAGLVVTMTILYRRLEQVLPEQKEGTLVLKQLQARDVFLKVLGSLTEPDSLHFFPKWSAGNFELVPYL